MKQTGSFSADIDVDIPALEALAQHHFQLAETHLDASAESAIARQTSPFWAELNSAWNAVQTIERARAVSIVGSATSS